MTLQTSSPILFAAPMTRVQGGGALVGGTGSANAATSAGAAPAASTQAQQQTMRSMQDFQAAAHAIMAQQSVQAAARSLANSSANPTGVADGLSDNGLHVAYDSSGNPIFWVGANLPSQSVNNGQYTVDVQQTAARAVVTWDSFNVGKNTILNFDQRSSSDVVLNRIVAKDNNSGPAPSQILGQIKAQGGVYVINPNGVIFYGSSQINVHTFVASSLDLTSQSNFLNGNGILSSDNKTSSFQSVDASSGTAYLAGDVKVQAGAQITAQGGDVLLFGSNVQNNGTINTPSGQALLLGGSDVILAAGDSYIRGLLVTSNLNAATNWQGTFYSSTTPGTVINNGLISAPEGNITIVAGTINQNGDLLSTTSTTENGSIILRAEKGPLTLGGANDNPLYAQFGVAAAPSVIQITPDSSDKSLVTDTQAIANSSISLTGTNVDIRGIVQLQGYDVTNKNDHPGGISIVATGTNQTTTGNVFLEDGSILDASGMTDASASASRNSVAVELRTNELADSPVVKDSPLYQQTIYVDASASGTNPDGSTWQGTALANASGWIAQTARSLDERMMNGAPITISGGVDSAGLLHSANLVQAPGSIINVSGGYMTYTPGYVQVSNLITADGQLVSASNANPDVDYAGIASTAFTVSHPHWNVTQSFANKFAAPSGYYDPGYIQGGAGGSLTLNVSSAVLGGQMVSSVVTGSKQRTPTTAPIGASLNINGTNPFGKIGLIGVDFNVDEMILSDAGTTMASQWVKNFNTGTDLNAVLTANSALPNSVYLSSSWVNSGFTTVNLEANDKILVAAGNPIVLPAGGSFSARANTVDIESSITAPGGTISLPGAYTADSSYIIDPNGMTSARSGLVVIGEGITLSTAGLWTNDRSGDLDSPIVLNGGTITIGSYGDIDIGEGSVFDVSGGGYETTAGKITGGNGGSLSLTAGLVVPSNPDGPGVSFGYINFAGGTLAVGQLKGYGVNGGNGGSLSLASSDVASIVQSSQMSGALLTQFSTAKDSAGNTYTPLSVSTDFFSSGGFAKIGLTAAGIDLPEDVTLAPVVSSLAISNPLAFSAPSVANLAIVVTLPQGNRQASSTSLHATGDLRNRGVSTSSTSPALPTSVDLTTYGLNIAGTIQTDPKGSVNLTGDQIAVVSGIVDAPGGTITFGGGTYSYGAGATGGPQPLNGEGVWLTDTGKLLATGTAISVLGKNGVAYQDVLAGGQVTVSGGDIVLAPGSVIDVSGSSGAATLAEAGSSAASGGPYSNAANQPTNPVTSAGGTISISAILGAVLEGTLLGKSGGGNAAGGTLNISLAGHGAGPDVFDFPTVPGGIWPKTEDTYITLQQNLQPGDSDYVSGSQLLPGNNSQNNPTNDANIPLSIQMVTNGGFNNLVLNAPDAPFIAASVGLGHGFVTFSGNATLTLPNQLVINTGTIIVPNGTTETLQADYVQWNNGTSAISVVSAALPGVGTGKLSINANTVDLIGNLAVQGAQTTTFNVAGDLRLTGLSGNYDYPAGPVGSFVSDGEIDFVAGQIYPSTDTTYSLASATKIVFNSGGNPPAVPLSANGVLNIYAPEIDQSGTLRAPTGVINLGSNTSQTIDGVSIAATTTLNLGASSITSVSAGDETVLFGYVSNGTDWYYQSTYYDPNFPSTAVGSPITAPPSKQITIAGKHINVASGAVLDESGGGDLYGGEFVPGTGGSKDIFSGSNVYAIIPGYTGITPYDPMLSTVGPSVGMQVYLNSVPGLPAGVYTLLPGQYAELPGAFRVTVQTSPGPNTISTTRGPIGNVSQPDGSYLASGYLVTPGTGTIDEHWSVFQVMSDSVARRYSEIDNYYANSFFTAQAVTKGTSIPRLPEDAGQLSIIAVGTLDLNATGIFSHPNGLGGIADISADQILVVDDDTRQNITNGTDSVANYAPGGSVGGVIDPDQTNPAIGWNPIVLSATGLDQLGVESLLLGGSRSFQTDGVHLSPSATEVVVANDATNPLILPDIQLIAAPHTTPNTLTDPTNPSNKITVISTVAGTGQVIIAPNAMIEASGAVAPGGATTYILSPLVETPPQAGNFGFSASDITAYYQTVAANQVGYVRLSGGNQVTIVGGNATYAGLPQTISSSSNTAVSNWGSIPQYSLVNFTITGGGTFTLNEGVVINGSGGQSIAGAITAINGNMVTVLVDKITGSGSSTGESIQTLAQVSGQYYSLPTNYAINGAVTVGAGAKLTSDNSLALFASGSGKIAAGVTIDAQAVELKSTQISLGTSNYALPGLVLDQTTLNTLAGVKSLTLVSSNTIDLYGDLTLGEVDSARGQPILGNLTFDSAGLVEKGTSGTATFTAEQVTLQNSIGGSVESTTPISGTSLEIVASDVTGISPNGIATGYNNGQIMLGSGAITLAGFGNVDLKSSGQIVATGNGGSLSVEAPLTLDAPRISAGTLSKVNGVTNLNSVSYTINANDNPANPGGYYAINLMNSSSVDVSKLPTALLGDSLSINGGQIMIDTDIALPGGAFNVTANGADGSITVGSHGDIDVSGQAVQFGDVLATIGGGNINLTSALGKIAIQSSATLNVSDLADVGALNKTTAGNISLTAVNGGVSVAAGTLQGRGPTADSSGTFTLDTNTLDPASAQTYDALASVLVAGGFDASWNIRARSGNITMTGLTQARNVAVSADAGNIDIAGTIDAHGVTGGQINIWAGNNLTLESTAVLNAHGATADANRKGGQIWLGADAAGNGTGVLNIALDGSGHGAKIDVEADAANSGVSGPVLGGQVTLSTGRTADGTGVNLNVTGNGNFANFVNGITGESTWDGVSVVGNRVYSYQDSTLYITPSTTIAPTAPSGGVETVAFTTFLNDANTFMNNQSGIWKALGADGNGVVNGSTNGSVYTSGVLVNIRPGITIKNTGTITIEGDATNPKGIDLSGSAYAGSVLNTGDPQTLDGHFGQYDEPVVLAIRAAGNLNFGTYTGDGVSGITLSNLKNYLTLGSLSDGFSQYTDGLPGNVSLGAGASAWAALFDPAAQGTYNGLSGGLGADSATYFLTAGADLNAANPLAVNKNATAGSITVAGVTGDSSAPIIPASGGASSTITKFPVTTDPLYLYNYSWNGGNAAGFSTDWLGGTSLFADYASLVRTGTGNISVATAKDLILQSPLSLIYTAGTGYNVNGTSPQPLSGFTQYKGTLTLTGAGNDYLPPSTFPTHGGDLTLAIGGNILGGMNATTTMRSDNNGSFDQEDLPYDMTALGSQLKLQNWILQSLGSGGPAPIGSFNDLYATDTWMTNATATGKVFYLPSNLSPSAAATTGDYQLAWYTWFPYLENTIGSFGGGNISVKAGGSISHVQFVSPTNARDAGPALVATSYAYNPTLLTNPTDVALNNASPIYGGYSGLYVQGGGDISVSAGEDITDVYTYAQNGKTTLKTGGSAIQLFLATASGDVSVQARGTINIADKNVSPTVTSAGASAVNYVLSGISLIQNASFLSDIPPTFGSSRSGNAKAYLADTVLTGILTSPPTGSVNLDAIGSVTLAVASNLDASALDAPVPTGISGNPWNTNQGILPAQLQLISLGSDVVNNQSFITYPDPQGSVTMLALGSVNLNAGFVVSDANPVIMPTLSNIVSVLEPYQTVVTADNASTATITPAYDRLYDKPIYVGGANYLAGEDPGFTIQHIGDSFTPVSHVTVLEGDVPAQLISDVQGASTYMGVPYLNVDPVIENQRHGGLHVGTGAVSRIIAMNGDVTQGNGVGIVYDFATPFENINEATEVYAGRNVADLALIGQNNNANDITSVVAGRDVIYTLSPAGFLWQIPFAIEVGGPGNLLVESGRNINLGNSAGIQTFGNFLNSRLPGEGASITIETGLGNPFNLPDYSAFTAQYVDPPTAASNQYAEPLELFDASGNVIGSGDQAYAYLQTLSTEGQQILINRIFSDLLRDSGREHTGATSDTNYELGSTSIDTIGVLNAALSNYQRAYAAINTFLGNTSGTGSFLGGLSTVRTINGGNITVLSPHGQIQVGLVAPPSNFPGYSKSSDPTWALNFGIVTEKGGDIDLYADGNISVNQSRVFTLEGGDMTVVSKTGNIDAGKGAKTVQSIQPPNVAYDSYGNITITPYGPASGSGLAVLRALPDVPLGNADLIAFVGDVNAGDAGIRVSGNINIAAVLVLNAGNIQVGGSSTGVPIVVAPNISGLATASNAAGGSMNAATDVLGKKNNANTPVNDINVEIIGFGDASDNGDQQ